ncbi:2-oxoglutarate and iron-dependent oxygenase domain-containing protein [Nocardia sp. NPDC050710]|uniref:isopenicillin N synthase family dioxygenase n=1 Tax=Nocardia sp. NPDC050710 TaxID=3157220 RepID=UPI0033EC4A62
MSSAHAVDGILEVPVIDISAFRDGDAADRARVAAAVDRAATEVGFMQIVGHGIPESVRTGLAAASDAFFGLPMERKLACVPAAPGVNRGYTAPRTERLSHSLGVYSPDDLFEAFNIGTQATDFPEVVLPQQYYPANLWPEGQDPVRAQISAWFTHAGAVARTMTRIFAVALGLPEEYFTPFEGHTIDVLRMNNYQLPPADAAIESGQLGMGAHTDYGIVTILWADAVRGLQILDTDGVWHDVIPVPGALLVNLGDLLARWTNDRWISTLHRVLPPVDAQGSLYRRRSAAYFHDGNFDAVIETLPGCVTADRPAHYPPITVAEHLTQKLAGSRGLELNADAEREAARLRAAVTQ